MKARLKKYRYLLLFAVLCLLLLLLVIRPGRWLMSERDVLEYYRQTYGQEMEILSRNAEEFQEGDTHTRSQVIVLRPLDQPDLEFQFDEWAGYAYSPGPIPQIFPSFSRSFHDHYPSDALFYALREFVDQRGLGTVEETDDERNVTITADDWEDAVRQIVAFTNSLQDVSPYNHLENIWLLTFRRTLDGQTETAFRANLLPDDRLDANAEEIIQQFRISGNLTRAANQFIDELDAFLSESGLSYRSEYGYNNWIFCRSLTVSIDVASWRNWTAFWHSWRISWKHGGIWKSIRRKA